jgi:hypothetical protein
MVASWYLDYPRRCTFESKLHLRNKFDEGLEKTRSTDFNMKGRGEKKGKSRKRKRNLSVEDKELGYPPPPPTTLLELVVKQSLISH